MRIKSGDTVRHAVHGYGIVRTVSPMAQYCTVQYGGTVPGQGYIRTHAISALERI